MNTEDKQAWVGWGVDEEAGAIQRANRAGLPLIFNPARAGNKYAIDAAVLCDIKTRRTPFQKSEALYGIPSRHCVTLNVEDVERYPSMALVLFDVHYESLGVNGRWIAFLDYLMRQDPPIHEYMRRKGDTVNKQRSYVLDLRRMKCV